MKNLTALLEQLKLIEESSNPDEGGIKRSLMDAEKLKLQIIQMISFCLQNMVSVSVIMRQMLDQPAVQRWVLSV